MKKIIISFVLSLVILSSCNKDKQDDNIPGTPTEMKDLKVPANFDWKTTKDIKISITANTFGLVEVFSSNNEAYQKVFLTADKTYEMKLTVPAYEKVVKLKFSGQEKVLELNSGELTHQFN
jgi:beta-mannanase